MTYKLYNQKIIDELTGEIIVKDLSPKFQDWVYEDYLREFKLNKEIRFLEPQTAQEADKDNIPEEGYIAEEKFDGHRALCFITAKGNRLFSRRISKKSRWYAENTDCLPHIRDFPSQQFRGTVIDGEITTPNRLFAEVQGITGALPSTAITNQGLKGFGIFNAFDILYYKGTNIQAMPLWKRKIYLAKVVNEINHPYIKEVKYYAIGKTHDYYIQDGLNIRCVLSFKKLLEEMWENGGEGLILKDLNARYEQKRSKSFLKLKGAIYRDVVVMGYEEPTKLYEGSEDETWKYWYHPESDCIMTEECGNPSDGIDECFPITKPFAMGWVGAITCGVYKNGVLVPVVSLKGFKDEEQEYIKANRENLLGTVLEVEGQDILDRDKGSIRHPRFSRWRQDKSAEMCTWEDHIL
jgi:ATP-dependent DNA ligase